MPQRSLQETYLHHLILIQNAINLIKQQKYRRAVQTIKQSLNIYSNHATLYYLCSLCFYSMRDIEIAQRCEKISIKMNPLCQIYELDSQKALLKIEQIIEVSIKYENKLMRDGEELVVNNWYEYTVALHEATDFQQVESVYRRLFTTHPKLEEDKSYAFLGNYANVLYDMGKYDIAVVKYETQIKRDPSQLRFFSNCAVLYTIIGDYSKAEQYIKVALNKMPDRTNFIFNYANVLSKMKKFDESNDKIKQCIQKQSHDPIFRVKLAINISTAYTDRPLLALAQENLRKSIVILNESLKTNNNDLVNCGRRILSTKNITCIKYFSELLLNVLQVGSHGSFLHKFLSYFSDYLIVGQATKLELNSKVLDWLKQVEIQAECNTNFNNKSNISISLLKQWHNKIYEACIRPSISKKNK